MIKDISKIMTWHVWKMTYLRRNVTIVCGSFYHLLGSWISQYSKIRFRLQVESYISDWRFSKSRHLASYVSRHNAMAYDSVVGLLAPSQGYSTLEEEEACQLWPEKKRLLSKERKRRCCSCTKKEIMRLKKGLQNEVSRSVLLGLVLSCDNPKTMT